LQGDGIELDVHHTRQERTSSPLANSRLARAPQREFTETILPHNSLVALAMLYRLRALGVPIALDDCGAGYSALRYTALPVRQIRIDRSNRKGIVDYVGSVNSKRIVAGLAPRKARPTTAAGKSQANEAGAATTVPPSSPARDTGRASIARQHVHQGVTLLVQNRIAGRGKDTG